MIRRFFCNIYFFAFSAAISGLLFGYDAGIISGAMLFIKKTFDVTNTQIGEMVGAVPLGALLSSIISGRFSDLFGRKKILMAASFLFIMGSLVCSLAISTYYLIVGRLFIGFAVGMSSSIVPVYISEISDKERRGKLVTLFLISVNFGIFISYAINF